jgi:gliding motility-associated lipoprotein GldB
MSYKIVNYRWVGIIFLFAFAKANLSCTSKTDTENEIAKIPVDVTMQLFHQEFEQAGPQDLAELRQEYPRLLPKRTTDSILIAKMTGKDSIQNILENAVNKAAFDYGQIEQDIEDVMRHVKYYFREFQPTPIITLISEVEYNYQVIPSEEALYVALDTYLGKDHELYIGINQYIKENLNIEQLPADVGMAYAELFVEPTMDRTLLGSMVYYGKLHYLQRLFVPEARGDYIFNYPTEKYQFTVENEEQMWRYIIGEELLYDTDSRLLSRFILPAPFSKFYLEVDQQTPGGVGKYLGYRIVQAFMDYNEVDLDVMINLPAEEIFKRSKYKPE